MPAKDLSPEQHDELNPRQRRFVELYDGNARAAAEAAGYSKKSAQQQATELMANPKVLAALKRRVQREQLHTIADRRERHEFWSKVLRDEAAEMKDRLKASELLGKAQGDFIEQHHVTGQVQHVLPQLAQMSTEQLLELARVTPAQLADGQVVDAEPSDESAE